MFKKLINFKLKEVQNGHMLLPDITLELKAVQFITFNHMFA